MKRPCEWLKPISRRQCKPITGLDRPWGFQEVEISRFNDTRHTKVISLSALRTDRLYPPGNTPGTHFCWSLSQPQSHSVAGRIMSMKNSNETIGNRTRDLPACCVVTQSNAPPCVPVSTRQLNVGKICSCRTAAFAFHGTWPAEEEGNVIVAIRNFISFAPSFPLIFPSPYFSILSLYSPLSILPLIYIEPVPERRLYQTGTEQCCADGGDLER
jgi:hypothetical protein